MSKEKHPDETVYIAWDNANTHQDDEIEAVLRAAAGRLVLLYLPTYNLQSLAQPIERLVDSAIKVKPNHFHKKA